MAVKIHTIEALINNDCKLQIGLWIHLASYCFYLSIYLSFISCSYILYMSWSHFIARYYYLVLCFYSLHVRSDWKGIGVRMCMLEFNSLLFQVIEQVPKIVWEVAKLWCSATYVSYNPRVTLFSCSMIECKRVLFVRNLIRAVAGFTPYWACMLK